MGMQRRGAAQYVRMSTDRQELSPIIQKEAIAAYAKANALDIVASYEDEARSGVYLKNRPGLRQLLRDVTQDPNFGVVLVYDVSRWGRFQDADASAYYDYHCRLHNVEVFYVAEAFGNETTPMGTLAKNMKRVMAAEFSRELASKSRGGQHRVINMGYQMGQMPPLGYRRCSVSADARKKVLLEAGQRKLASTDRIQWILGPDEELAVIRRLCEAYACGSLTFKELAALSVAKGWTDWRGRPLTNRSIASLIRNEALIGNFVWGRHCHQQRIIPAQLCRVTGSVPRIIDDLTWSRMQARLAKEALVKDDERLRDELRRALRRKPMLIGEEIVSAGCEAPRTYRQRFGSWAAAVMQAGGDPSALACAARQRASARRQHIREFGHALAAALRALGLPAAYDVWRNALRMSGIMIQLRVLWRIDGDEADDQWQIREREENPEASWVLLVRMREPFQPLDYFVVPAAEVAVRLPQWLVLQVPAELRRFWYRSPHELVGRLRELETKSGVDAEDRLCEQ